METNSLKGFWIRKVLFGKFEDLKRIILSWKYTSQDLKGSSTSNSCIHTHHKVPFVADTFWWLQHLLPTGNEWNGKDIRHVPLVT
jgi:hypothetical protein